MGIFWSDLHVSEANQREKGKVHNQKAVKESFGGTLGAKEYKHTGSTCRQQLINSPPAEHFLWAQRRARFVVLSQERDFFFFFNSRK